MGTDRAGCFSDIWRYKSFVGAGIDGRGEESSDEMLGWGPDFDSCLLFITSHHLCSRWPSTDQVCHEMSNGHVGEVLGSMESLFLN